MHARTCCANVDRHEVMKYTTRSSDAYVEVALPTANHRKRTIRAYFRNGSVRLRSKYTGENVFEFPIGANHLKPFSRMRPHRKQCNLLSYIPNTSSGQLLVSAQHRSHKLIFIILLSHPHNIHGREQCLTRSDSLLSVVFRRYSTMKNTNNETERAGEAIALQDLGTSR